MATTAPLVTPALIEEEDQARKSAMRNAGLIEDAEDDEGLVFPLPEGIEIAQIINRYDTRDNTKRMVRCAACKQHQLHNRGFTVSLNNGQRTRIGINCGEQHFGQGVWKAALADYDRRVEHANYLARVKPALDGIERLLPIVIDWHSRAKKFSKWFSSFRISVPDLHRKLVKISERREGRLEQERGRTKKRINRFGREESYRAIEVIEVGRIPYPEMFVGFHIVAQIAAIKEHLTIAHVLFSTKSDSSNLARAFALVRKARQATLDASNLYEGGIRNLSSDWLPSLCTWANQEPELSATYTFEAGWLTHDEGGDDNRFPWPEAGAFGPSGRGLMEGYWP